MRDFPVRSLKDLEKFVADRPNLKAKVDETLANLSIENYVNSNPAIEGFSIYGGNPYYLDDGSTNDKSYVRCDTELQEINITLRLMDETLLYIKITQKYNHYKVQTRVNYSEGMFGKKGKANVIDRLKVVEERIANGVNPFQKELDNALYEYNRQQIVEKNLNKELEVLEGQQRSVPKAYAYIKSQISSQKWTVSSAKDKLAKVQEKYDGAK